MLTNLFRSFSPVLAFFIFLFSSAQAQKTTIADTSNVREIRINPGAALGEDVAADDIFSLVRYIPLETTPASLFGNIDQLELIDGHFIILDKEATRVNFKTTSAILIFDKDGKFKARIAPGEMYHLSVDQDKKEVIVDMGMKFVHYDLAGKIVGEEPAILSFTTMHQLPGSKRVFFRGYLRPDEFPNEPELNKKQFHDLVVLNADRTVRDLYMPVDTAANHVVFPIGGLNYFTRSGNELMYKQPFSTNVYQLTGDIFKKSYHFVYPLSATPPAEYYRWTNSVKDIYINSHRGIIYNIMDLYKAGNILAFTLHDLHQLNPLYFYNLKNNLLTSSAAIKTNTSSLLVPLTNPVTACDGSQMYTWVKSRSFFSPPSIDPVLKKIPNGFQVERSAPKSRPLSSTYTGTSDLMRKFLKNGSAKDNPVLVIIQVI